MRRHRIASTLGVLSCFGLVACDFPGIASGSSSTGAKPADARVRSASAVTSKPKPVDARSTTAQTASSDTPNEGNSQPRPAPINIVGLEEQELRDLLGTPAAQEDRPPGKIWRYRKGGCALDVTLYPDVQTRKFGTLSYEVKSDDGTDQGKRACLADIQSGARAK